MKRTKLTGITPEWSAFLFQRSAAIYAATQKKGMPMLYGGKAKDKKS